MDYPEPDYEPTTKEKLTEALRALLENNCLIEQPFHKDEPEPLRINPDLILVIRKDDGTNAFVVEPEVMERLITEGLVDFTISDHPNNEHFRVRAFHPLEPSASDFLRQQRTDNS